MRYFIDFPLRIRPEMGTYQQTHSGMDSEKGDEHLSKRFPSVRLYAVCRLLQA